MYSIIIILPLIGTIFAGFFGRTLGIAGSQIITSVCVILATLLSLVAFKEVAINETTVTVDAFKMIDTGPFKLVLSFTFDSLTVSMLIPVLIVSCIVHIYSIEYMSTDPHNQRFFSYLSLFTFMMIVLVTGNNLMVMFIGWEGVGVCSYLLVNFWFTRLAANQSSMSAFLTNRVGDCFLMIGLFITLCCFGNVDYCTIFSCCDVSNYNASLIITICLLIGAMAKSSQIGLHVWLPLAMEGPTPVSALIHAATMVTAGVYLLIRTSPLIDYDPDLLIFFLLVGASTTLLSSIIGLFQQDIKKVIAYSTMSQLGMMVIALGLSWYNVALFHLVNHAFYKALLFLGAGTVIHAVFDNQDFRKYGSLKSYLPLTYSVMLIASFSLIAIPFMSGFYSKDLIMEYAYGQFKLYGFVVYFIAIVGAIFTTLYSIKVLYSTFLSSPSGPLTNYKKAHNVHEGGLFMMLPLIILAIFSVFFGYIAKDFFTGLTSGLFSDNSLFIHPLHETMLDTEFAVSTFFKLLPLLSCISFFFLLVLFIEFFPHLFVYVKLSSIGYMFFSLFNKGLLIDSFHKFISYLALTLGYFKISATDKGFIEQIGPMGLEKIWLNIKLYITYMGYNVINIILTVVSFFVAYWIVFHKVLLFGDDYTPYHQVLIVLTEEGIAQLRTNFIIMLLMAGAGFLYSGLGVHNQLVNFFSYGPETNFNIYTWVHDPQLYTIVDRLSFHSRINGCKHSIGSMELALRTVINNPGNRKLVDLGNNVQTLVFNAENLASKMNPAMAIAHNLNRTVAEIVENLNRYTHYLNETLGILERNYQTALETGRLELTEGDVSMIIEIVRWLYNYQGAWTY